jgi:hypothetical protein
MTEIASTWRRRKPSTRSVTLRLVAASLMASAAIAGGLAIQMGSGHDPALGAGTSRAQNGAASNSASNEPSDVVGQTQDRSGDFRQAASPPASVTTRSS